MDFVVFSMVFWFDKIDCFFVYRNAFAFDKQNGNDENDEKRLFIIHQTKPKTKMKNTCFSLPFLKYFKFFFFFGSHQIHSRKCYWPLCTPTFFLFWFFGYWPQATDRPVTTKTTTTILVCGKAICQKSQKFYPKDISRTCLTPLRQMMMMKCIHRIKLKNKKSLVFFPEKSDWLNFESESEKEFSHFLMSFFYFNFEKF